MIANLSDAMAEIGRLSNQCEREHKSREHWIKVAYHFEIALEEIEQHSKALPTIKAIATAALDTPSE